MSPSPSSPRRRQRADALLALASGPVSAAESALSARSRPIPPSPDFHFYNSFPAFRSPTSRILSGSHRLLTALASSPLLAPPPPPPPDDPDDALPWLSDLNDEFLERLGSSLDEFEAKRSHLEREMGEDGFQVVSGKKKKKGDGSGSAREPASGGDVTGYVGARVLVRDKRTGEMLPKVPFHLPNIPRPQDAFCILVNNSNQPFEHVWLERSEDGTRFVHPLEKLSVSDFVDRSISDHEPGKPQPLEDTPFKLVEEVKELKELAIKLRNTNEFAVDLEHNQYRSFQGLTCLMQISTRTEDFVVDTLKLRIHIGPHLREFFKDPSKRKVMHGADRDILWLQRDFGIYVCNLFDTGQASRILQLERNSLEYLLHHYCGTSVNKEYQNAEWRLRPVPVEMLKYAREDTHYLLYLYDLMRQELLKASSSSENGDALLEAYKRSYDVCMQLYDKDVLTGTSYLHIYGLREADFNSQQLAVAAALCEWRDDVARAEDESTGYILPNRALLEIARQLPSNANKLRRLVKSKHPFVERHIGPVVSIIKNAMHNAAAYECISEQLKKERLERASESKSDDACKDLESNGNNAEASLLENVHCPITDLGVQSFPGSMGAPVDPCSKTVEHIHPNENTSVSYLAGQSLSTGSFPELKTSVEQQSTVSSIAEAHICSESTVPKLMKRGVNVASIQVLKKPSGAFGALLGSSTSKPKPHHESRKSSEMVSSWEKLEEIKSSVSLPFHSFSGVSAENATVSMVPLQYRPLETQRDAGASEVAKLDEIILLGGESDDSPQSPENADSIDNATRPMGISEATASIIDQMHDPEVKDEPSSLAELSSSLQKCFNTLNQSRSSSASAQKPKEFGSPLQLTPFDYSAARRELISGCDRAGESAEQDREGLRSTRGGRRGRRGSAFGSTGSAETAGASFQPPRRSHAFPPTGNRNATFR